jgi:uncharacterized protein
MHYLLFYDKAADHAVREPAHSAAHLAHLHRAIDRGELLIGGPVDNPLDGTNVLLFDCDSLAVIDEFAKADPYVLHGIVTRWHVRSWETVVGPLAACPLPGFESTSSA